MARCPSCSSTLDDWTGSCPRCGSAIGASALTRTADGDRATPGPARAIRTDSSSDPSGPIEATRFLPGAIVAGRYRIVGLAGKGGMGEVYRADDLKLGQPVALKFLPEALAGDATRLARFLGEVRIARQVSHPNVCRVHDIEETDRLHFISMEYVDGEDLARLLRRIGRLPQDRAVVVARQICAGLSAAHDKGILHRDLKPANIMIDGRGQVRITDFGLAVRDGEGRGANDRFGTPYYMAPEQLAGAPVSVRGDLYALGLILYELFTGGPAFTAGSLADLVRARESGAPPSPGSRVEGLDPAIERVILACLEMNPGDRPASARAVAAALPGGDSLRAALEAGETPSPELVAAAGATGSLSARAAWACAALTVAGLAAAVALSGRSGLHAYVSLDLPPQVLEHQAREIVRRFAGGPAPRDTQSGFSVDAEYLDHIARTDPTPGRWEVLRGGRPAAITFWYRESPLPLLSRLVGRRWPDRADPPLDVPGMAQVVLDTHGRLTSFTLVPRGPAPSAAGQAIAAGSDTQAGPDWIGLFKEADLDPSDFRSVPASFVPPVFADARAAWEPADKAERDKNLPARVEAAALGGRPVSFEVTYPWQSAAPEPAQAVDGGWAEARKYLGPLMLVAFLGAALAVARRNLRQGRGHRSGAMLLASFTFIARMLTWLFGAPHVIAPEEANLFFGNFAYALFDSAQLWVLYIAIEPALRRLWPEGIVSWVRALDGRLRDPLVGRDTLIGVLAGVLGYTLVPLVCRAAPRLGLPASIPAAPTDLLALRGPRFILSLLCWTTINALETGLACVVVLLVLHILLRRRWLAIAALTGIVLLAISLSGGGTLVSFLLAAPAIALGIVVLLRVGVLAWVAGCFAFALLASVPLTLDLTAWYGTGTALVTLVLIGMAIYGVKVATHGRAVAAPGASRS